MLFIQVQGFQEEAIALVYSLHSVQPKDLVACRTQRRQSLSGGERWDAEVSATFKRTMALL